MKKYLVLLCLIMSANIMLPQNGDYELWSFETGNRIYSDPFIHDNIIYFGSNDNTFYAIDADNGSELWQYQVDANVQSGSAIKDSIIFFESGNSCYALNKDTGEEIWVYENNDPQGAEKLDDWDYHHATPVIDDSIVYFGFGNGLMLGFDVVTGSIEIQTSSIDSIPIRSTPAIYDGMLYFGDWDGIAYCYDINAHDTIWTRKTFTSQPYPTFGMLNTKMMVYDSILLMGARNPRIYALNAYTGEQVWTYMVSGGGWISGDPIVEDDVLYIGGSDCNKLFALDVHTGSLLWDFVFLYNNYSEPHVCGDYVMFTTGNAYANGGTNYGSGYLYALYKNDGTIKNFSRIGGNIFTTPVFHDGQIIVGSDDTHLYALDSLAFISDFVNIGKTGYNSINDTKLYPNPFTDSITINYNVNTSTNISVIIYDLSGREIRRFNEGEKVAGEYSLIWNGTNEQNHEVPAGYYIVDVNSKMVSNSNYIVKQ